MIECKSSEIHSYEEDPSYIIGDELEYPRELFLRIDSSGWSFVSTVLGQMTYLVASLTLDSANSCVMLVVVVGVVIVVVIIGVFVVVGDVSSVLKLSFVIIGWAYAFHQDKASSVRVPAANVILFSLAQFLRENTDSVHLNQRMRVSLGPVFLLGLSVFAMVAAIPSAISCRMAALVMAGAADVDFLLGGVLPT
nr:hypothetical protein [Tanacetum cinerariifolium]